METQTVLDGYSAAEKAAYISAIASIATADREASEEEMEYLSALADAAELSDAERQVVERAAMDTTGGDLTQHLDVLKKSELKYSLVADLIAFAKADADYSTGEEQGIKQISEYMGVNQQQFSLLDEFAENTKNTQAQGQDANPQNFFGLDGLKGKMQNAGINTGGLMKGLLAIAGPIILSRMMSRGRSGGGGLGGMLGGGLGGMLGGMLGGGRGSMGMPGGGGLGSLIGMLSGGRGFGGAGGMLGKILGGR